MVRAIAAVTPKPETATVAEPVSEALHQIASVESDVPNILLESQSFRSWVDADLSGAWRRALDFHIVTELQAATLGESAGGTGIFEKILYAFEAVRSAGYEPNVVAVSPGDSLALQLLQNASGVTYVFGQTPPRVVVTPALADGEGMVLDAAAIGELYLSPFSIRVFEMDSGTTNSSVVRGESNGLFLVQRPDAAATIDAAS